MAIKENAVNQVFNNNNFSHYQIIPIDKLIKANWNYKLEDDVKKEKLKENIKRNGQIENIIVRELDTGFYEIVNGNHRYDAFFELKFKEVIVYNLGKISLPHAQRIAVETNETKFDSDKDKLALLIKEINLEFSEEDLKLTMPFSEDEINDMLNIDLNDVHTPYTDIEEDNFEMEPPVKPITQRGDLYEFNGHRLYCGDSTKENDVSILMNGKKAHLLHTDPPYNVNYAEFNKNRNEHGKDWTEAYCSEWANKMSDDDYKQFLFDFVRNAKNNLIDYGHYYIWHASGYLRDLLNILEQLAITYDKIPIQWVKQVAPPSWVNYKRITEPCLFAGKGAVNRNGDGARWFGPNNETNAWLINREHNGSYVHPTQKPIALAARAITNSSTTNEIVLDLFLGSGTTLIASDMLGRVCYGMEYEPKFCDVIIIRYAKYKYDKQEDFNIKRNNIDITNEIIEKVKSLSDQLSINNEIKKYA